MKKFKIKLKTFLITGLVFLIAGASLFTGIYFKNKQQEEDLRSDQEIATQIENTFYDKTFKKINDDGNNAGFENISEIKKIFKGSSGDEISLNDIKYSFLYSSIVTKTELDTSPTSPTFDQVILEYAQDDYTIWSDFKDACKENNGGNVPLSIFDLERKCDPNKYRPIFIDKISKLKSVRKELNHNLLATLYLFSSDPSESYDIYLSRYLNANRPVLTWQLRRENPGIENRMKDYVNWHRPSPTSPTPVPGPNPIADTWNEEVRDKSETAQMQKRKIYYSSLGSGADDKTLDSFNGIVWKDGSFINDESKVRLFKDTTAWVMGQGGETERGDFLPEENSGLAKIFRNDSKNWAQGKDNNRYGYVTKVLPIWPKKIGHGNWNNDTSEWDSYRYLFFEGKEPNRKNLFDLIGITNKDVRAPLLADLISIIVKQKSNNLVLTNAKHFLRSKGFHIQLRGEYKKYGQFIDPILLKSD